jgi:hypothetical protein
VWCIRRLIAKLVVTYFSRQSNQNEVLNIMSSLLEFTEDEKIQVRSPLHTHAHAHHPRSCMRACALT